MKMNFQVKFYEDELRIKFVSLSTRVFNNTLIYFCFILFRATNNIHLFGLALFSYGQKNNKFFFEFRF